MAADDFSQLQQLLDNFTLTRDRQCFRVAIIDDTLSEPEQQFTVTLMIAQTNFSRVTVDPNATTLIIEDDDSKWSGLYSYIVTFRLFLYPNKEYQ